MLQWFYTAPDLKLGLKPLELTIANGSIFLILTSLRSLILAVFRAAQNPSFRSAAVYLFPLLLFGQSMLSEADAIAQKYSLEIAKAPPPKLEPQPLACLKTASIWFSIDLSKIESPAFETLTRNRLWDHLREIGTQGVHLKGLKKGGSFRTGISLDPRWGDEWNDLALALDKKGLTLIGDSLGNATGLSSDFALALKNVERGLYHLVEIEKKDWSLLPNVSKCFANVPWLTLQTLQKKGYVPKQFDPYVKESSWNATGPIQGLDGKSRRWIYLKENKDNPLINWLNLSFAGCRIAASDVLDSIYNLGQKIIQLDGSIEEGAQEMLTLWTRKLGGFSVMETDGGICNWKKMQTDLIVDTFTRPALLHALITEDAEALKLIYRLFLEEGIEAKRLVHVLQPFDRFTCDYAEFLAEPKKRFQYYEEILTGEALKNRLLKEDLAKLGGKTHATWPSLCMATFEGDEKKLMRAHLLLAFFYAMQPGAFSFSVSDLLGLTKNETISLMSPNENSLYGSLPSQMKNSCSFARRLKNILGMRISSGIETADLTFVPHTEQKGLLVLIHKLKGSLMTQMLAINFSSATASQCFDLPSIRQTSAIDLMSGLAEKKTLDTSMFQIEVPPLSGKVILFQPKYFD